MEKITGNLNEIRGQMTQTLVVVADSGRAKLYTLEKKGTPMVEVADLVNTEARMHADELVSDRKGRTFDSKGSTRHAKEARTPIKVQQAQKFARQICAFIETERKKNKFSNLVLVAAPGFLGVLRKTIGPESSKLITREIDKDLVLMQENIIRELLVA